jgi:hypothetical protein
VKKSVKKSQKNDRPNQIFEITAACHYPGCENQPHFLANLHGMAFAGEAQANNSEVLKFKKKSRKMQNANNKYITEKILIRLFDSSNALKNEIRRIIQSRKKGDWDFYTIATHGSYLALSFKKAAIEVRACCSPEIGFRINS